MQNVPLIYETGVVLLGGGLADPADMEAARTIAAGLVAADGGGDRALAMGVIPDWVIGDMDSLSPSGHQQLENRIIAVAEQESTDFGKCLTFVQAPYYICLGFSGMRLDHTLAALSEIAQRSSQAIFMLTEEDVVFRLPPSLTLDLPAGERVSLFPFGPAQGRSAGLRWPIDGLLMEPAGRVGTSNQVAGTEGTVSVQLTVEGAMLLMLPRAYLELAVRAVTCSR